MAKKKENTIWKELTKPELEQRLRESREQLFELRFRNATAPLKNHRSIRETRREIARALTFLKQKGETA